MEEGTLDREGQGKMDQNLIGIGKVRPTRQPENRICPNEYFFLGVNAEELACCPNKTFVVLGSEPT